jgi:hypothetical protein
MVSSQSPNFINILEPVDDSARGCSVNDSMSTVSLHYPLMALFSHGWATTSLLESSLHGGQRDSFDHGMAKKLKGPWSWITTRRTSGDGIGKFSRKVGAGRG